MRRRSWETETATIKSNTFEMEWPPRSCRRVEFPEVDRAGFFDVPIALEKINAAQAKLLIELEQSTVMFS